MLGEEEPSAADRPALGRCGLRHVCAWVWLCYHHLSEPQRSHLSPGLLMPAHRGLKDNDKGTSFMVQWLRIHLPMQET